MKRLWIFFAILLAIAVNSNANSNLISKNTNFSHNSPAATQNIDPHVLQLATDAYRCAALQGMDKKKLLTIIDYSKPSTEQRLWVVDMANNKMLFNTLVAHGKGSGNVMAQYFSNNPSTHASSLGLFQTANIYQGHDGYSMRLNGLEPGFNSNALSRAIVMHGAAYVNQQLAQSGRIGRSWGCPAVPKELAKPIINTISNGSLVFAYYPDSNWLKNSQYLHCPINANFAVNDKLGQKKEA